MKTRTTILSLLIVPFFLMGQSNSSIDFVSGFDYSYRTIKGTNDDFITELILESRTDESPTVNWRAGFNYNRKLTKKFYLKSGLRLASVGYKSKKITDLVFTPVVDPQGNLQESNPNLPSEVQFVYNECFAEIPIMGRFEFSANKVIPFLEIGLSPNIYVTSRVKAITDVYTTVEYRRNKHSAFNKLHFVGSLSFGCNYQIVPKYQLFGQSAIRYHLTKTSEGAIKEHLYNFGIEAGIRRLL